MPKDKFLGGVVVAVHPKGWMDEELVNRWVTDVWMSRPGGMKGCKSLLVWDMFRAHLCQSVKKKLTESKTHQAVIPGGCTSLLQPLDVCLNKPFKTNVRERWSEWMLNGDHTFTKSNAMRRAPLAEVAKWVVESWDEIPTDIVQKSFLKCGISNTMDGSEDDILFEEFMSPALVSTDVEDVMSCDDLDDYYDDSTDVAAWAILAGEDSDTECDGFTRDDVITTNSGKTTAVKKLCATFSGATAMGQDFYFLDPRDERLEMVPQRDHANWEKLSALDMKSMVNHVHKWIQNQQTKGSNSTSFLFIEGILIFNYGPLARLFDKKYFITIDKQTCKDRRSERVYVPADPPWYFEEVVWPMYNLNLQELREQNDICFLNGAQDHEKLVNTIQEDINVLLNKSQN